MANIFRTKRDLDDRQGRRKLQGVPYAVLEHHELWSTNS